MAKTPQPVQVTPEALAAARKRAFRTRREAFAFRKGSQGCPVLNPDELKAFCLSRWRGKPLMVWGPPGIGKSAVVKEYAASIEAKLFDVRLTLVDPVDLRGMPVPDIAQGICTWLRPEFLPTEQDGQSVLFLDELSSALPSVQVSAYSLVHDRRLGEYRVPDSCEIIAAGNREQDRGSTYRMLAPLANRFQHIEVEASVVSFCDYAQSQGWLDQADSIGTIGQFFISFLQNHPDYLWAMPENQYGTAWPSPRSWEGAYHSLVQARAKPGSSRWMQVIASHVGCETSECLLHYLNDMEKLFLEPTKILGQDGFMLPKEVPESELVVSLTSTVAFCRADDIHIRRALGFANQVSVKFDELAVFFVRLLENKFGISRLANFPEWEEFQNVAPKETSGATVGKKSKS